METKITKEARSYVPLGDDPIQNMMTRFAENPGIIQLLKDLDHSEYDTRAVELQRKMRELHIGNK